MNIDYIKVRDVKNPSYATIGSNGIDFYIPYDINPELLNFKHIHAKQLVIPSGLKIKLPKDHALLLLDKSGLAIKGLRVIAPLIDSDFQGEFKICLDVTHAKSNLVLEPGMKIIQGVILKMPQCQLNQVDELNWEDSERKEGGFGHTGLY